MILHPANSIQDRAEAFLSGNIDARGIVDDWVTSFDNGTDTRAAIVNCDRAGLRRTAEAVDIACRHIGAVGPLAAIPVSVKASIDVKGWATTHGLASLRDNIAGQDAIPVARLRRAGALLVGQTNCASLSLSYETESQLYGRTLDVFYDSLSPGGSGAGCAVAVAEGRSLVSLGTDAGGSMRIPAAFAGVSCFRPGYGRMAASRGPNQTYGYDYLQSDALCARSAADLAIALDVVSGPHPSDSRVQAVQGVRKRGPSEIRIGYFSGDAVSRWSDEAQQAIRTSLAKLNMYSNLRQCATPDLIEPSYNLFHALIAQDLAKIAPSIMPLMDNDLVKYVRAVIEFGNASHVEYGTIIQDCINLRRRWSEALSHIDVLIAPVWVGPRMSIGSDRPDSPNFSLLRESARYCSAVSVAGLSSLTVPVSGGGDRPTAVQLISRCFQEDYAFQVAEWLRI